MPIISNNTFLFDYWKVFFYIYSTKFMNKFKENNKEKYDKNLLNNLSMNNLFKEKHLMHIKNNYFEKDEKFSNKVNSLTKEEKNFQNLYMNLIPNDNEQKITFFQNSINNIYSSDNNSDNKINNIFYNFSDECLNHKRPNENFNNHKHIIMSNLILNKLNDNTNNTNNSIKNIQNKEIFLKKKTMRNLDISKFKKVPKIIMNNHNLKYPIELEKKKKKFNIIKNYDKYDSNAKTVNYNNNEEKNVKEV